MIIIMNTIYLFFVVCISRKVSCSYDSESYNSSQKVMTNITTSPRSGQEGMAMAVSDSERILPIFMDATVKFYLFIRNRSGSEEIVTGSINSVKKSHFSPQLSTKILVHGYRRNGFSDFPHFVKNAYLAYGDEHNIICVDWKRLASDKIYLNSAYNTRFVGEKIGDLLIFLKNERFISSFQDVHVIGFSLGAQVSGYVGKYIISKRNQKIGRITGLDPAGPSFTGPDPVNRLDKADAEFVDVIHTSIKSGLAKAIGHADFFPNGGLNQPGCTFENVVDPLLGGCSHLRSVALYVESIRGTELKGCLCKSWTLYSKNVCNCKHSSSQRLMGEHANFGKLQTGGLRFRFREMLCKRSLRTFVVQNNQKRCFTCGTTALFGRKVPILQEDVEVHDYGKPQLRKKRLYVFGCHLHGALGLPSLIRPDQPGKRHIREINRPIRHEVGGELNLTHVAAGHGFSLLAARRNENLSSSLFGTGLNTHSQLGHQAARANAPLEVLISFVPIYLPISKNSSISAIGAGRAHSIIAVKGGGLLALGDNSAGQCGRSIIDNEAYFGSKLIHRVNRFETSAPGDEIVSVLARYDVTYCTTRNGEVFSFGANFSGQLGRGRHVSKPWDPDFVVGDLKNQNIVKISSSGSSTMALNDKGEIFAWGSNEGGYINPYDTSRILYEPKCVKLKSVIGKIIDVAVGDMFSFVLDEKGNVYVWGQGPCLGLGPSTLSVKYPTLIPPPLFGRNEFNPTNSVRSIETSYFYSAAITSDGSMYTWGRNSSQPNFPNGCLGLGPLAHQYFPLKVSLGGHAEKVALGLDHTLVLKNGNNIHKSSIQHANGTVGNITPVLLYIYVVLTLGILALGTQYLSHFFGDLNMWCRKKLLSLPLVTRRLVRCEKSSCESFNQDVKLPPCDCEDFPTPDSSNDLSQSNQTSKIKWEEEELTHKYLVKQACTVTVDSVTRLITEVISSLEDIHILYRELINVFMGLLEESRCASETRQELLTCKMIVVRSRLDEIRGNMRELELYLCTVERLAHVTAETAFLGHSEYPSIALIERLQSALLQAKLIQERASQLHLALIFIINLTNFAIRIQWATCFMLISQVQSESFPGMREKLLEISRETCWSFSPWSLLSPGNH